MPWPRASAQVILPFPLLVHRVSAYASGVGLGGVVICCCLAFSAAFYSMAVFSQCGSGLPDQLLERLKVLVRPR